MSSPLRLRSVKRASADALPVFELLRGIRKSNDTRLNHASKNRLPGESVRNSRPSRLNWGYVPHQDRGSATHKCEDRHYERYSDHTPSGESGPLPLFAITHAYGNAWPTASPTNPPIAPNKKTSALDRAAATITC